MKNLILIVGLMVLVPACMTTTPTSATRPNLITSQSPKVIPSPTATSLVKFGTNEACKKLFLEVTNLTEKAQSNEEIVTIVDKVVEAGEYYLNNCTNPAKPLASQKDQLTELIEFAQLIPPYTKCATRYQPIIELMDLNGKGEDELILHTQAIRCDIYALFGFFGGGGLTLVFHLDESRNEWKGNVLLPCSSKECPWTGVWTQSPQPLIQRLPLYDSQERTFMLVVNGYLGGDHYNGPQNLDTKKAKKCPIMKE